MYLSRQSDLSDSNNLFYISIIEDILEGNNSMNQKEIIDRAIFKARSIALEDNENDIYTIKTESYSFVITLLTKFKENLKEMTTDNVNENTYNGIIEVLQD